MCVMTGFPLSALGQASNVYYVKIMQCTSPVEIYPNHVMTNMKQRVRCGRCMGCRIHRRNEWTTRMWMESQEHQYSLFVTLTYSDQHLPESRSLEKKDLQLFMKRLRFNSGQKIRYFFTGEYGPKTERPHYHGILYGLQLDRRSKQLFHKKRLFYDDPTITENWQKGFCSVAPASPQSMRYTAGYILKHGGPRADEGWSVKSTRPGLGLEFATELASMLRHYELKEVPSFLLSRDGKGKKIQMPLDNYIRDHMASVMRGQKKSLFDHLSSIYQAYEVPVDVLQRRLRAEKVAKQYLETCQL